MRVGDQLELTVRTRVAAQVEIARLGLLEDAAPDAPAHFSLLPAEPGKLAVSLAGGRTVAVIRVHRIASRADGVRSAASPSLSPGSNVQDFLRRVFGWMFIGLLITGGAAAAIGSSDELLTTITENPLILIG